MNTGDEQGKLSHSSDSYVYVNLPEEQSWKADDRWISLQDQVAILIQLWTFSKVCMNRIARKEHDLNHCKLC
jgi:hypothetical protein